MSEAAATPSPVSAAGYQLADRPGGGAPRGSLAHAEMLLHPLFDAEMYAAEYRDVAADEAGMLRHFCLRGWREGRNPNRHFDTATYLLTHRDVAAAGMNPYYHYLLTGQAEGRAVQAAFLPSEVVRRAAGREVGDWVGLLRAEVDVAFYIAALGHDWTGNFDPVAHYCYLGWLQGRDPNSRSDIAGALAAKPELRKLRLNPSLDALLASLSRPPVPNSTEPLRTTRRGFTLSAPGAPEPAAASPVPQPAPGHSYGDPVADCVAQHLDRAYYLAAYPDVLQHGADPVSHYCSAGWREGRKPTAWFDTAYYLASNPDVAAAGLNPFWHFLVAGRAEGRRASEPGGYRKRLIDQAAASRDPTSPPAPAGVLSGAEIAALLRPALEASTGLAISVSHDHYINVTGGIQLFLAEEQGRFARLRMTYLHVSPFINQLRLADAERGSPMLNLVLDGALAGVATAADLGAALQLQPPRAGDRRLFVVHCLLGHDPADLADLQRACGATENYFWVHDYSALCAGYNLLRNDVAFCGAPPPGSMACRVCVYGEARGLHVAKVRALFDAVPFRVVAPSAAALQLWRDRSGLPHVSATVQEHCRLVAEPPAGPAVARSVPVRVGYVGHTRPNKGWPIWLELVAACGTLPDYRFFHLGAPDTRHAVPGLEHHSVVTTPERPDAMVAALAALEIDLVVVPSPWPETFCYVAMEALAAGADVICLADSGNVAETVLRLGRGVVASRATDLIGFFATRAAARYAGHLRKAGAARGRLVRDGTTTALSAAS